MAILRALAALLVWSATALAQAQSADVPAASAAETFFAEGDGMTLHLRISGNRQVELFAPATGERLSGVGLINNRGGVGGFTGMLANGTAFGITGRGSERALWIGDRTFALRPMGAAQFGVGPPPAALGQAAPGSRGAAASDLAGLRLHTAKFNNGYGSERSYDLCADGRVFTRWSESQSSQFGSAASEHTDQGRWQHHGNTLLMSLQRGGAVRLEVERAADDVVRLNGTSYSANASSRCR